MAEESNKKTSSKKFAVGELPPSPTTSTSKSKRPRHHVKRRSSGRVHVTKLAPMARAAEEEDKKSIKRSHSQKSLSRLNDKKQIQFTTQDTPPSTPPQEPSAPFSADDSSTPFLKSQFVNQEQVEEEKTEIDQWLEKLTLEYQAVKQHRDPMKESLIRCQYKHRPNHHHQRSISYSVLENADEQRHQILLKTALQRQHQEQEARNNRWTTGTFLDRLLYG